MARIAAISLAKLSLKNIPKNRLIQITNFVIFIAFFAVSASIISLYYEKKIEGLNKQLSNEYGNEIIDIGYCRTTITRLLHGEIK